MRSLNDYFIDIGFLDLKPTTPSAAVVVPDGGQLLGAMWNAVEAVTVAVGDLDVQVNTVSAGTITIPIAAVDTSDFQACSAAVYVATGDAIVLIPDGTPTAGEVTLSLIIRR